VEDGSGLAETRSSVPGFQVLALSETVEEFVVEVKVIEVAARAGCSTEQSPMSGVQRRSATCRASGGRPGLNQRPDKPLPLGSRGARYRLLQSQAERCLCGP